MKSCGRKIADLGSGPLLYSGSHKKYGGGSYTSQRFRRMAEAQKRSWATRIGHLSGWTRPIETEAASIGSDRIPDSIPFAPMRASRNSSQKSTSQIEALLAYPAEAVVGFRKSLRARSPDGRSAIP
jgi:hypothetical protein